MTSPDFILRPARRSDLDAVNSVIEAAVMAEQPGNGIIGVSACEPADQREVPKGRSALLLHGIYILPEAQNKGIGSELVRRALQLASDDDKDGLLVGAQRDATGFFQSCGMKRLPDESTADSYVHRYWMEAG